MRSSQEVRLSDVAERITVGIATAATHAYRDQGIPLIRNTDIRQGRIDTSNLLYLDPEFEARHWKKRLRAGDVVTVRTGNPGISAVVPEQLAGAQCFTSLITSPKLALVVPEYLCEVINSAIGKRFFGLGEAGGAQKNVNAGTLRDFHFPLPSLRVQRDILRILDVWTRAEQLLSQRLASSRQRNSQLASDLLVGARRFPKFRHEDWAEVEIGQLVQIVSRPVQWSEEKLYRLASVRRWGGGVFDRGARHGRDIKGKSLFAIHRGDILVSHIQAAYGAIALVPGNFEGANVSSTYSVLVPREDNASPEFLGQLFNRRRIWHEAYLASNGFFAERLRLCFDESDFLRRRVRVPTCLDEQRNIASLLDATKREESLLITFRAAISRQKRGLLHRLLMDDLAIPDNLSEAIDIHEATGVLESNETMTGVLNE